MGGSKGLSLSPLRLKKHEQKRVEKLRSRNFHSSIGSHTTQAAFIYSKTLSALLEVSSDDVASRLQVSDLYKSDLQVSSRFANDLFEI